MADTVRDSILARIRRRAGGEDETRRKAVEARLGTHRANLIPKRAAGDLGHRVRLFREQMEGVGGTVEEVADPGEIPGAVAKYLRDSNLPARIRHGADPLLNGLPWHRTRTLEVLHGPAIESDKAALSRVFAGVAESGTVVLVSGEDNPTTLNFLPEAHIVVVEAKDLVGNYEEAWTKLRARFGEGQMPRTVNMISGPSRTGDVEQTIVRPAHGPKNMHVIVVRPQA